MTGQEQVLIEDWCQQYPSLSVGGLAFGADGALYASAGTGSSFTFNDWGQDGDPVNPCGDPPGGVGAVLSPPTAEGGSLRGQDTRTGGDPVTLDGTVIRVDPNTGSGLPENPLAASGDANARRIVAYGLRTPSDWPFAPEPIRSGLVTWERATSRRSTASPIPQTPSSRTSGGPVMRKSAAAGFDSADLNMCETLYSQGAGAVTAPYLAYAHSASVVSGELSRSSSISGFSFYTTGSYPAGYVGALFFADYSRNCIWVAFQGPDGQPDMSTRTTFVAGAAAPVDLQVGPGATSSTWTSRLERSGESRSPAAPRLHRRARTI